MAANSKSVQPKPMVIDVDNDDPKYESDPEIVITGGLFWKEIKVPRRRPPPPPVRMKETVIVSPADPSQVRGGNILK